jgi:hypothetical protein
MHKYARIDDYLTIKSIKSEIKNKDDYYRYSLKNDCFLFFEVIDKLIKLEIELDKECNVLSEIKNIKRIIQHFIDIGIDPNGPSGPSGPLIIDLLITGSNNSADVLEFLIDNNFKIPFDTFLKIKTPLNPRIKKLIKKQLDINRLIDFYSITIQGIPIQIREMIYNLINNNNMLEILLLEIENAEDEECSKNLYLKKINYSKIEKETNFIIEQLKMHKYYEHYLCIRELRAPTIMSCIIKYL